MGHVGPRRISSSSWGCRIAKCTYWRGPGIETFGLDDKMDVLRDNWWTRNVDESINLDLPGIYEWRIGGHSLYIGKSARLRGRIREYPNNVRKLIAGEAYRKGKPTSYREIHRALRIAHDGLVVVTLTVLENCERADLNQREQYWIATRRAEEAQGGPRVLNATKWRA